MSNKRLMLGGLQMAGLMGAATLDPRITAVRHTPENERYGRMVSLSDPGYVPQFDTETQRQLDEEEAREIAEMEAREQRELDHGRALNQRAIDKRARKNAARLARTK